MRPLCCRRQMQPQSCTHMRLGLSRAEWQCSKTTQRRCCTHHRSLLPLSRCRAAGSTGDHATLELWWSPLQRHLRHGRTAVASLANSPRPKLSSSICCCRLLSALGVRIAHLHRHTSRIQQAIDFLDCSGSHQVLPHTSTMSKLHTITTSKYQGHQVIGLSMRSAAAPRARACLRSSDVRPSAL